MHQRSFTSDGRYRFSEGYGPADTLAERFAGAPLFPRSPTIHHFQPYPCTHPTHEEHEAQLLRDSVWGYASEGVGVVQYDPPLRYYDPINPHGDDFYHHSLHMPASPATAHATTAPACGTESLASSWGTCRFWAHFGGKSKP